MKPVLQPSWDGLSQTLILCSAEPLHPSFPLRFNVGCISSALASVFCYIERASVDKSLRWDQGLLEWRWKEDWRDRAVLQMPFTPERRTTLCVFSHVAVSWIHFVPSPSPFPVLLVSQPITDANSPFAFLWPPFLLWRGGCCPSSQRRCTTHRDLPMAVFELLHGSREENNLQLIAMTQWLCYLCSKDSSDLC